MVLAEIMEPQAQVELAEAAQEILAQLVQQETQTRVVAEVVVVLQIWVLQLLPVVRVVLVLSSCVIPTHLPSLTLAAA